MKALLGFAIIGSLLLTAKVSSAADLEDLEQPLSLPSPTLQPAPAKLPELTELPELKTEKISHFPSLGPTLSVNVPHPIFLDVEKRLNPHWSFALGGGGLPLSIKNNGTSLTLGIFGLDGRARWHPFGGSFFLGIATGYQYAYGSGTDTFTVSSVSLPVTVKLDIHSFYITPHLGWLWVFNSGFTLGFELGWQVPFGTNTGTNIDSSDSRLNSLLTALQALPAYQKLNTDVVDAGNKFGSISLPYVTVLRLGWLF